MLDARLQAIYDLIEPCQIVADIGSDHAWLPIALVKNQKCQKVYACDVNQGPLNNAQKNIKAYDFENQIQTILTNGIHNIPEDVNSIVIAGMGYSTVEKILENDFERLKTFQQIIVQVNLEVERLRQWISDKQFTIVDEVMVKVKKHYYTIIAFNTQQGKTLTPLIIRYGEKLLRERSPIFMEYIDYRYNKIKNFPIEKYQEEIKILLQIKNGSI